LLEISIALDARDAKLAVGRELTKGNSFSARFFEDRNRTDYSAVNVTRAEQALIGTLSRLGCSPADSLLVTSGFCIAQVADSAPGIGGLAWKACYLADFSAQPGVDCT
jgi:hypothetical protein